MSQTLGLIGVGAFGEFMLEHMAPHFALTVYDIQRDLTQLAERYKITVADLEGTASSSIVVLAVPVQKLASTLRSIVPYLKPGTLVIDVGSVKVRPAQLMQDIVPATMDCVGLHPLFGPQSGKKGIAALNIAVCNVRGSRFECVCHFLKEKLKLNVLVATPEEHDKELAYVQGLTHLLAKVIVSLDLPKFRFTTKTYDYLNLMVEMIRYHSDELFQAIERENPFSGEAKKAFFAAARQLEDKLMRD